MRSLDSLPMQTRCPVWAASFTHLSCSSVLLKDSLEAHFCKELHHVVSGAHVNAAPDDSMLALLAAVLTNVTNVPETQKEEEEIFKGQF